MAQIDPLSQFPIITTDNPEVAEVALSQSLSDVSILKAENRENFSLQMNGIKMINTSLVFNRFNSHTIIGTGRPVSSAVLTFGSNKPVEFKFEKKSVIISPRKASFIMPGDLMQINRYEGSEILALKVELSDLQHLFEKLTDRKHQGPLSFNNSVDLTTESGVMLQQVVRYVSYEINHNNSFHQNNGSYKALEHLLLTAILTLPHSHRDLLFEKRRSCVDPPIVRRAEEYMRAHLNKPIVIKDLLMICSCSRSALFAAFKKARGYSPMEFLTEQRLLLAREKLIKSTPGFYVSSIALECGFIDQGRFARAYRKRFGELPSETLKR